MSLATEIIKQDRYSNPPIFFNQIQCFPNHVGCGKAYVRDSRAGLRQFSPELHAPGGKHAQWTTARIQLKWKALLLWLEFQTLKETTFSMHNVALWCNGQCIGLLAPLLQYKSFKGCGFVSHQRRDSWISQLGSGTVIDLSPTLRATWSSEFDAAWFSTVFPVVCESRVDERTPDSNSKHLPAYSRDKTRNGVVSQQQRETDEQHYFYKVRHEA